MTNRSELPGSLPHEGNLAAGTDTAGEQETATQAGEVAQADPVAQSGQPDEAAGAARAAAERRLTVLWNEPRRSPIGRRATIARADVVAAAISLADESGLDAVTMRAVAGRLSVAAMSLYTHVPGKVELLDLMLDAAYRDLDLPEASAIGTALTWQDAVRRFGGTLRAMFLRHPWAMESNQTRLPLTPALLDAEEFGYRALRASGLPAERIVEFFGLLVSFVRGQAAATATDQAEVARTGLSNDDYWESMMAFWERYFDAERYPTIFWIWQHGGFDEGEATFERGLERYVDAVERSAGRTEGER